MSVIFEQNAFDSRDAEFTPQAGQAPQGSYAYKSVPTLIT